MYHIMIWFYIYIYIYIYMARDATKLALSGCWSPGGRWDPATHPEWSSIPIGVRTVLARVWACTQWPFRCLRGVADSRHAPPVTGTKDPGGCLWLPLGLAAKVLVVAEVDYFRLSRCVQHAAASSETMNSSCGSHASRTSFGARLPLMRCCP